MDNQTILITGGTGSFGQEFVKQALKTKVKKIIVFSRDEYKQHLMHEKFQNDRIRYFIGDVRDKYRLKRAFSKVDIVVHAAALKRIPAMEYNPMEAIKTNVIGSSNVINVAIDKGVKKVIAISTDKACRPINLYGATKLCMEKLFVQADYYTDDTKFAVVRYGNVFGSRGSIIPLLIKCRNNKSNIPLTDKEMTRFFITLSNGIKFVMQSLTEMKGGEIFIPKMKSKLIYTLAKVIAPNSKIDYMGIRPGEKLHEELISEMESRRTIEMDDKYIILSPRNQPDDKVPFEFNSLNAERIPDPDIVMMLIEDINE